MAGYGLPNEQHLYVVLEEDLKKSGQNIKVVNGSVSGSTSSAGLNRAEWTLSEPGIDLIVLGLGANDMLRGIKPSETEKNLEKIILTAKEKNMIVMNTPGGNSNATAEHAFALIMSVLRKIPFANETTHKGQWEKKNIKGTELSKKTLGIVGFGNVGVQLSYLVKGFNMEILVSSKSLESRKKDYPHVKNVSFDELISKSDIISFHCKAAKDGKSLITKEHYKKMKSTAVIINTARGNIVDENDLNEALNKNLIAGAAVDVFSKEPAKENILFNNPKAILTPHIAASTTEASIVVAEMVANQISDFLLNGVKKNTV